MTTNPADLTSTDQPTTSGPWQDVDGNTGPYDTLADILGVTGQYGTHVEVWDSGTDRAGREVITVHSVDKETGGPSSVRFYATDAA